MRCTVGCRGWSCQSMTFGPAASFLRQEAGESSGLKHLESDLLQGDRLSCKVNLGSLPLAKGVRHGERYHDVHEPCQSVCLGGVSTAAVFLCSPAGTGAALPKDRALSSH